jgi:allantoinase
MMFDLALRGNAILTPEGSRKAVILIKDGIISDIVPSLETDANDNSVDVGDLVVMPGVIDPHVHINEPGRTEWEGCETATTAAASGGITTLVDMPLNASPVTTSAAAFEMKVASTKNKLYTNCGFWGGVVPGNENDIEPLIAMGVLGFKAFLTHSGIDDFPNATERDLRKVMPIIAKHQLPLLVHCELTADQPTRNNQPSDKRSYQQYLASRPKVWENKAIALMIRLCEEFNCPVHIVHLSSSESIDQIRKAKEKGLPLTVETAQHYLYFHAEGIPDGQTAFKCAPPIREKANTDALWNALQEGIIDFVATDHSPAPPDLKQLDTGDFTTAWGGVASIQFALPVLWKAARERNIGFEKMAGWLCEKPALLLGSNHKKGKIAKGYDADLCIWNPHKSFKVDQAMIHHRHKVTPYLNETVYGVVEQTYLAGIKIVDHGKFLSHQGKLIMHNQ